MLSPLLGWDFYGKGTSCSEGGVRATPPEGNRDASGVRGVIVLTRRSLLKGFQSSSNVTDRLERMVRD